MGRVTQRDDRTVSARTKKDKIVRVSNESRVKRGEKATGRDATLFPDTRGPNSRGPTRRRRAEPGARASARSEATRPLRAVASRARSRRRAFRVSRSSAGWTGHAPASDDFIVILADAFAGKNALLPATAPLLAAARPMRAAVTPRPEPDTARLAMDMQREADIVDVRCRWNGRRARSKRDQNPKTPPRDDKNEAPHAFLVSAHISKHFRRVTARSFRRPSAS